MEEQTVISRVLVQPHVDRNVTPSQVLKQSEKFDCLVDASWMSNALNAGIAWTLYHKEGEKIMQGSSSIELVNSPKVAETLVLKMAVQEITMMQFTHVLFMGDSKDVYDAVKELVGQPNANVPMKDITIDLQDIARMAISANLSFLYVPREAV